MAKPTLKQREKGDPGGCFSECHPARQKGYKKQMREGKEVVWLIGGEKNPTGWHRHRGEAWSSPVRDTLGNPRTLL